MPAKAQPGCSAQPELLKKLSAPQVGPQHTFWEGKLIFFWAFLLWKSLSTDFDFAIAQPRGTAAPCTRPHKGLSVVAGMRGQAEG